MNIEFTRVTWYSQALAIILAVCIFGLGFYAGQISNTPIDEVVESSTISTPDTSKTTVSACGREYSVNTEYIDGVNVATKMAELLNNQSPARSPSQTICYWVNQNNIGPRDQPLTVEAEIGIDKPLAGKKVYRVNFLTYVFFVDAMTNEVYTTNEMDTSPAVVLGTLK